MDRSGLPDINTLSPRACGPQALGVYIRQAMSAHVTIVICHLVAGHKSTYVTNNSSKH